MEHPSAKIQLTNDPPSPMLCTCCGKNANGKIPFVDFNASVDYYGAVVLCIDCAKEAAALVGFVPDKSTDKLKIDLEEAYLEIERLGQKLEVMENVVFTYRIPVDTPHPDTDNGSSDSDAEPEPRQGSIFS
jgi:hypothetical protein